MDLAWSPHLLTLQLGAGAAFPIFPCLIFSMSLILLFSNFHVFCFFVHDMFHQCLFFSLCFILFSFSFFLMFHNKSLFHLVAFLHFSSTCFFQTRFHNKTSVWPFCSVPLVPHFQICYFFSFYMRNNITHDRDTTQDSVTAPHAQTHTMMSL